MDCQIKKQGIDKILFYLKKEKVYSIYCLWVLENFPSNQFNLYYIIDKKLNFGMVISNFTKKKFLFLAGKESLVKKIINEINLPKKNYLLTSSPRYLPLLKKKFKFKECNHQYRMAVTNETFLEFKNKSGYVIKKMTTSNINAMHEFYLHANQEINFDRQLTEQGAFYGAFIENKLIGCAGTHFIDKIYEHAEIGNIYTDKNYRGQGIASALTSLVTKCLINKKITKISLSVNVDNKIACRIYKKLGYQIVAKNIEGIIVKKNILDISGHLYKYIRIKK